MKKTLLQLAVLVGGVLGFALLLDRVINLTDEIPPIVATWAEAAPGPEQAPERVGPERVGPERAGPDKPAIAAAGLPVPLVQADPGNVRLMLQMVRDRWLMVRPDNGQDYLYFSTVLPYRQARYDLADGALPYWRAGA